MAKPRSREEREALRREGDELEQALRRGGHDALAVGVGAFIEAYGVDGGLCLSPHPDDPSVYRMVVERDEETGELAAYLLIAGDPKRRKLLATSKGHVVRQKNNPDVRTFTCNERIWLTFKAWAQRKYGGNTSYAIREAMRLAMAEDVEVTRG